MEEREGRRERVAGGSPNACSSGRKCDWATYSCSLSGLTRIKSWWGPLLHAHVVVKLALNSQLIDWLIDETPTHIKSALFSQKIQAVRLRAFGPTRPSYDRSFVFEVAQEGRVCVGLAHINLNRANRCVFNTSVLNFLRNDMSWSFFFSVSETIWVGLKNRLELIYHYFTTIRSSLDSSIFHYSSSTFYYSSHHKTSFPQPIQITLILICTHLVVWNTRNVPPPPPKSIGSTMWFLKLDTKTVHHLIARK